MAQVYASSNLVGQPIMPGGVIGNTSGFGPGIPSSSLGRAAKVAKVAEW